MALIKNSMSAGVAREAIILNLSDLQRQADEIKAKAHEGAAKVMKEAEEQRRQIIADAAEIGRAEGRTEGLAKGRSEGLAQGRAEALEQTRELVEGVAGAWEEALGAFEASRDRMFIEARSDVLDLAMEIARRVTKRAIEIDPAVVVAQLEAALSLTMARTRLVVAVNPADRSAAGAAMPALADRLASSAHAELVDDASLERGSCVVRSERGMVDASIGAQLDRIAGALGARRAAAHRVEAERPAVDVGEAPREEAPPPPGEAGGAGESSESGDTPDAGARAP